MSLSMPQFEHELAVPEVLVGTATKVKDRTNKDTEELEGMRKEVERLYEEQSLVVKQAKLSRSKGGADMLHWL